MVIMYLYLSTGGVFVSLLYVVYSILILVALFFLVKGVKNKENPKIFLSVFAIAIIGMMIYLD